VETVFYTNTETHLASLWP